MKRLLPFIRSIGSRVHSFIDWWFHELVALIPGLACLGEGRTVSLVRLGADHSEVVFRDKSGQEVDRLRVDRDLRNALAGESGSLRSRLADSSMELSLAPSQVCLLAWQQPGGRRLTRDSIRYRLLQESPIDTASVAFDWHAAGTQDNSGAPPLVEVALCRKEVLTEVLDQMRALGLDPAAVGFASPQSVGLDYIFSRPARSRTFSLAAHKKKLLLAGLIVWPILAMMVVGTIAALEVRSIRGELEEQHKSLGASEALLHRQAELSAANTVLREAASGASYASTLDELGGLLPPDAWFAEITIEGRSMRIVGFGADPTSAVTALSKGRRVRDIRLASVSSPNPSIQTPQFELTAVLGDRP